MSEKLGSLRYLPFIIHLYISYPDENIEDNILDVVGTDIGNQEVFIKTHSG